VENGKTYKHHIQSKPVETYQVRKKKKNKENGHRLLGVMEGLYLNRIFKFLRRRRRRTIYYFIAYQAEKETWITESKIRIEIRIRDEKAAFSHNKKKEVRERQGI
jgi:hypothetical protein